MHLSSPSITQMLMLVVLPRTEVKPQGFPSPADVSALYFSPAYRTPEWFGWRTGKRDKLWVCLSTSLLPLGRWMPRGEEGRSALGSSGALPTKPTQISSSPGDSPCPRQSQQGWGALSSHPGLVTRCRQAARHGPRAPGAWKYSHSLWLRVCPEPRNCRSRLKSVTYNLCIRAHVT